MQTIDAHVHLYPPEINRDPTGWAAAHGEIHWAALCTRRRRDGSPVQTFPTLKQLVADMDAAGISRAVLLGWYWENHAACVLQNRFYRECLQAEPQRFAAFATVHPGAGTAVLDVVRQARDAGFCGLGELSPHSQRVPLGDPVWRELLALAGELKLPVNLHVTDPAARSYPGRVETPLADFVALAREFPGTNFILAHWGGGLAWSGITTEMGNVWYDTAATPLLYDRQVWSRAPSAHILFGSDYPLRLYPKTESKVGLSQLVQEAKAAGVGEEVWGGNATQLLNLG